MAATPANQQTMDSRIGMVHPPRPQPRLPSRSSRAHATKDQNYQRVLVKHGRCPRAADNAQVPARRDAHMAFFGKAIETPPRRLTAGFAGFEKPGRNMCSAPPRLPRRAPKRRALFAGADNIQEVLWPDSLECSAASSAIVRDTRSRSRTAAITPHTTATTNAIHEKRVSQRSAATPA